MVAALELYFDHGTERRVRRLWAALDAAGVPSLHGHTHGKHRPHLSLVTGPVLDPAAVVPALDGLDVVPPVALSYEFAGVFVGRVLWLGPGSNAALLAHQAAVWQRLAAAGVGLDPRYAPGAWVPHTTVAQRVPRPVLAEALRLCLEVLPIEARFAGAALADHARGTLTPLAPGRG